jgi:nicotinamide-nucleotide amidase
MDAKPTDPELTTLAAELGRVLEQDRVMLATAESCTGGWVSRVLTAISGSSAWFERGFVTYSDAAKQEMLGVDASVLRQHGAVSEPTARAMAEGALRNSHAQVALAVTGIAGPNGGTAEKPVGTVWFAWAGKDRATRASMHRIDGDRESVRRQSVEIALRGMIELVRQ